MLIQRSHRHQKVIKLQIFLKRAPKFKSVKRQNCISTAKSFYKELTVQGDPRETVPMTTLFKKNKNDTGP
jgi:hypothetical protein